MSENLFYRAAKGKLRFQTAKGLLSTEDLFDLSLESLDKIAVGVDEEIQKAGRKSFIGKTSSANTENNLRLDILKFVIEGKQVEADIRKDRAEKAAKVAKLEELLLKKRDSALENLTEEEIAKQLAELKK